MYITHCLSQLTGLTIKRKLILSFLRLLSSAGRVRTCRIKLSEVYGHQWEKPTSDTYRCVDRSEQWRTKYSDDCVTKDFDPTQADFD